jgi:hypothetical protein
MLTTLILSPLWSGRLWNPFQPIFSSYREERGYRVCVTALLNWRTPRKKDRVFHSSVLFWHLHISDPILRKSVFLSTSEPTVNTFLSVSDRPVIVRCKEHQFVLGRVRTQAVFLRAVLLARTQRGLTFLAAAWDSNIHSSSPRQHSTSNSASILWKTNGNVHPNICGTDATAVRKMQDRLRT